MNAAELLAEVTHTAMNNGWIAEVVCYGALKSITEEAFKELPAGIIVGLFETLAKDERTGFRARVALALCAESKVAAIDVEAFLFFGAGLWNMAARMVLEAVKNETNDSTRALLIGVVDGLLQDSSAMLVGFVNMVPGAIQDIVSTKSHCEATPNVPMGFPGAGVHCHLLEGHDGDHRIDFGDGRVMTWRRS